MATVARRRWVQGELGYGSGIETRSQLPAIPASASDARRISVAALTQWDLLAYEETVSLLVTELVSNGVRHARTMLDLILSFDGSRLRIAVADGDPRPPEVRTHEKLAAGGWGLVLVDVLASAWGVDIDDGRGKTVWVELSMD